MVGRTPRGGQNALRNGAGRRNRIAVESGVGEWSLSRAGVFNVGSLHEDDQEDGIYETEQTAYSASDHTAHCTGCSIM